MSVNEVKYEYCSALQQLNTYLSAAAACAQDPMPMQLCVRVRRMHCGDRCGAGNRSGNAGPLGRETTGEQTEALLAELRGLCSLRLLALLFHKSFHKS